MLVIRTETPGDRPGIHSLHTAAFSQELEAEIVDRLRSRDMLMVSLVALSDGRLAGHIAFSPVTVKSEDASFQAVALGPMAVLPEHQRKGIGSRLVRAGLEECRRSGHEIAVVAGHPDYYPRFGFLPARAKGLECEFDVPDEAWMLLEVREGALGGRTGTVLFQPEFKEAA